MTDTSIARYAAWPQTPRVLDALARYDEAVAELRAALAEARQEVTA